MVTKAYFFLRKWYIVFIAICVVAIAFLVSSRIPKKPELGFSKQLLNPNEFHSSIPNVFNTTISHTEKQVNVTVNREGVSLSFQLPLEQSTIKEGPNLIAFSSPNGEITTEYSMRRDGLKENIILNKIPKENVFPSTLKTQGLITKISAEGIPVFFDKDNTYQFHFERPYVKDGSGAISYAVKYKVVGQEEENVQKTQANFATELLSDLKTITQTGQTYVLQVEVDSAWLHDPKRVLPITIDPTVIHNSTSTFATGTSNGTVDTGSGATPSVETTYQELPADIYTVGLWHMNEASGNTLDSSGNGYTGTPTGTSVVPGKIGNARSFSGTDYISLGSQTIVDNLQNLTVEAWVYPSVQTAAIHFRVFTENAVLYVGQYGNQVSFYMGNGTSWTVAEVTGGTLQLNRWSHVAWVKSETNYYIYINGELTKTGATAPATLGTSANENAISTNTTQAWGGSIDEVRVSNIARSSEEIKADASRRPYASYTSPVIDLGTKATAWNSLTWSEGGVSTGYGETLYSATNLIAQWNLNDSGLTTASVYAGSCGVACNGTLTGFSNISGPDVLPLSGWTRQNQRWGTAAVMFDGVDDYIATSQDVNFTNQMTGEIWVKFNDVSAQQIFYRAADSTKSVFQLQMQGTSNNSLFRIRIDTASTFVTVDSILPALINKWYYLAWTYDGALVKLYVDGVLVGSSSLSGNVYDGNTPITIGAVVNAGVATYPFKGIIDSTRIYSRAFAANEIQSNYNSSNLEFQTRVGNTTNPTDGTWETWKPITSETQLNSFDSITDTSPSSIAGLALWLKADALNLTNLDTIATWNDSSGNGRNFTQAIVGQQPVYMTNIINGKPAVRFTAANSQTMTNNTNFSAPSTVIYVSRQTGGANGRMLSGLTNNWLLGYHSGRKRAAYFAGWLSLAARGYSDTNWHIYESVHTGSISNAYEDGQLFASNSNGVEGPNGIALIGYLGASEFSNGDIAEVIVFNKVLSDNERKQVEEYLKNKYNLTTDAKLNSKIDTLTKYEGTGAMNLSSASVVDSGTVALWHLDESGGVGSYIKDSGIYANNGTPTGTSVTRGVVKNARAFNGSSDFIAMPDSSSLDIVGTITIDAWIQLSTVTGYQTIVGKRDVSLAEYNYAFRTNGTNLEMYFTGSGLTHIATSSNTNLTTNKWYHVAVVYDSTFVQFYVNGVMQTSSCTSNTCTGAMTADDNPLGIGRPGDLTSQYLNGKIDEVRISNVPRSSKEIMDMYTIGANRYYDLSIAPADLSSKKTVPFLLASDRPGTYLTTTIGKSLFTNYEPDTDTVSFLHFDNMYGDSAPSTIQMTSTNVAAANAYTYVKTLNNASVVATGDTLEYDVYLDTNAVNIGTVDIRYSDGTYARSTAWTDQNSLGCTGADLTSVAYQKWYHRKCTIISTDNGKTISWIDLVNENDGAILTTAYFDNFSLYSSAGVLKSRIYYTGAPGFNVIDITSNVSNTGTSVNNINYPKMWKVSDESGGNDGYNIGSTTYSGGILGSSLVLNGTNYIDLDNPTSLQITGNQTIEMWLYPTDLSVRRNPYAKAFGGEGTITQETTGILSYYYGTSGSNTAPYTGFTSTTAVTANKWNHIAVVRDLDAMKVYWYINGQKTSDTTAPYISATASTADAKIGAGYVANYIGRIDEFRMSKVARSASDIRQAYEAGLSSHSITIDFGAKLDVGNLIADSTDLSFTIDATMFGLNQKGSNIYPDDKIIVRENYNGTEYIAQGTVASVTANTGAVIINSWDPGSTFPTSGFTAIADVFKWQREYWDVTDIKPDGRNSIRQLSLRLTNGNEGRSIWLDDIKSTNGYLTIPTGSSVTSSTGNRYFQYRTIFTSTDASLSAKLTSVTLNYNANVAPTTPSLDSPPKTTTSVSRTPTLQTTGTDIDLDYLQYKIQLCTDAAMTLNCQTFDQTSSQTGWSAQNAETGTTYTTGMQGSYTLQTPLNYVTTYYWRSYAIDPGGANTWTGTQATPFSFTTTAVEAASSCKSTRTNDATNTIEWTDVSGNETGYKIQRNVDNGGWVDLNPSLNPNTVSYIDSTVQLNHSYQYRIAPFIAGPQYGAWCTTQTQTVNSSVLEFGGGFNFSGITIQ